MKEQEKRLMETARTYLDSPANPTRRDELCAAAIGHMLHTLNERLGLLSPKEQAGVVQTMTLTEQLIYSAMQQTLSARLPANALTNYQSDDSDKPSPAGAVEAPRHGRSRHRT
jgi:hypothetical protein